MARTDGSGSVVVRSTCPRDCYDGCGIEVHVRDGEVQRVLGDPDHAMARGSLCTKCAVAYNGSWIDRTERLLHPLRRTGPKGPGSTFEPVSWGDALADIASRITAIAEDDASSIFYTHYTGTLGLVSFLFPYRFFFRLGATEVDPDTVCNKAGELGLGYSLGEHDSGFDPATAADSSCILIWGANPSVTAPHVDEHWLRPSGAKVICIDPIAHDTAKRADLHLQLRPGSDAALAFGILHVLVRDGLLDDRFLGDHVLGWEELAGSIAEATPERTEQLTAVAPELVNEAAALYAHGPSLLWLGQGMQRQPMGGNAFRSAMALVAATGNIGKPGAGVLYLNGPGTRGLGAGSVVAPQLIGDHVPAPISHMDLADALEDSARVRALFTYNNNIAASSPDQTRLRAALEREDLFQVSIELFATDTTDYADYVLPAASFLEANDIVSPYFERSVISAQVKAVEPMGESLPNQEIFRRLAAAMGYTEPELFEPDVEVIAALLARTGLSFEELAAAGSVRTEADPVIPYADLTFKTPSGHIELASGRAESDGHPRVPFPHADKAPDGGVLRVLSPASEWSLNSSYGNDARVERRQGAPTVTVHPDEAARRGLSTGGRVRLANETGTLELVLAVSADVPLGTALVPKGRWLKRTEGSANANVLYAGRKTDMGESTAVHAVLATLSAT